MAAYHRVYDYATFGLTALTWISTRPNARAEYGLSLPSMFKNFLVSQDKIYKSDILQKSLFSSIVVSL